MAQIAELDSIPETLEAVFDGWVDRWNMRSGDGEPDRTGSRCAASWSMRTAFGFSTKAPLRPP